MTWILVMNDMRSAKFEHKEYTARAETRAELEAFLVRETVEPYSDGKWSKSYRQGGPLEWKNSLNLAMVEIDVEARVALYRAETEAIIARIPLVTPTAVAGVVLPER